MIIFQKIEELTGAENLENVRAEQYKFYEACTLLKKNGDIWDSIPGDKTLLFKKVGYALFGPPKQVIHTEIRPTQTDTNKNCTVATGYNSDQDKKIISIVNAILCCTDKEIKFSYVYVTYQEDSIDTSIPEEEENQNISSIPEEEENKKISSIPEEEENQKVSSIPEEEENQKVSSIPTKKKIKNIPVFKTQSGGSNIVYIDTNCRVYESWADFLTTNTLPDIVICYPLHGSYDIKTGFSVGFFKTPASSAKSKALEAADKVEKVISVGAGVAGVAALVVAAPVLAPCAVVGGAAAGIYGFGRCVVKILDKKKHNEPYAKEVVKGAFNVIAVAAAGALRVAEGAVVVSTKIAQGICGLNGFVGLLYSDNTTKLIELLDELCDQSSMISFYFNAASTSEAIENIRKALKINEDSDDVEVLLALVNVNSIQYSVDKGDVINIEKYVSENVTELVFKLLNTISTAEKDILILLAEINQYAQFLTEETSEDVYNKIDSNMSKLYGNLQKENEKYSSAYNQLISNGNEEDKHHILLILRYLMCSVSSRVREVNQYCNNIEHRPVCLMSYNVRCHPLEEVNRKIKDKIEQNKSFTDSSSELDDFLPQILDFLPRNATLNWNLTQYAQCLLSITDGMMKMFDEEIKQLKTKVPKKNPTCNDLNDIFEEIGIKGNYGKELFERVLQEYQVDQLQQVDSDPKGLTCVQAWYGMADNLNCYYSSCCDDPEELFDKLFPKKYNRDNFEERKVTENLTYWEPCVSNLPGYFVYSLSDKKQGLTYLIPSETDCKVSVKEPRQNGRMGELCASPN
ncbi:hypothetical protein J6590_093656 [Homalodisca vitripennis]|nr:hypothetical protein J6590_093656 [Homalodisca vitripennis]